MDEGDEDGVDAFRIGRPRQLEIVHWVEGLGPGGSMRAENVEPPPAAIPGAGSASFAEAVRAEHRDERTHLHMDDS